MPILKMNKKLCPVECLRFYLDYTAKWRIPGQEELILSLTYPHRPVSKDTIGRWIKNLLSRSGIDTTIFKAHSVRGAAASKALAKGVNIDSILQAADWSSGHIFTKFYKRSMPNEFSSTVLALK
jgi:site-specific recombinase XerD